jgi:ribokinase
MKKKILVIGSSNTDMVVKTPRFPAPGETILGDDFFMNQGGKGANQAVAVSRLGGDVSFVCKTGNDIFGSQSRELFREEGINTEYMLSDPDNPSGTALITIDSKGENNIVVVPGANGKLTPVDIDGVSLLIEQSDYILMQLEIPLDTVEHVTDLAWNHNKKVIINPAPAAKLPDSLLSKLFLITPNKGESEILSGVKIGDKESILAAAKAIHEKGVKNVIITLGADGCLVYNGDIAWIDAEKVSAVDTTAAGDVFTGALTVAISEGQKITDAASFAGKAAAISITRYGAIPSIPKREEVITDQH